MKSLAKWLEYLSLDAVLVALCWCAALGSATGSMPGWPQFLVLGLATWLTYVADRLWEVRPGKAPPHTDRHLFYQSHYKSFRSAWLIGLVAAIILAFRFLPNSQFLGGWGLVGVVLVYLWMADRTRDRFQRLLLKRLVVPIIFCSGVAWMAASWTSSGGLAGTSVLLAAAFSNVLIISLQENRDERLDWLPRLTGAALLLLLVLGNGLLLVDWPCGLAALYAAVVYFVLFVKIQATGVSWVRLWVDAALIDAALIILILRFILYPG